MGVQRGHLRRADRAGEEHHLVDVPQELRGVRKVRVRERNGIGARAEAQRFRRCGQRAAFAAGVSLLQDAVDVMQLIGVVVRHRDVRPLVERNAGDAEPAPARTECALERAGLVLQAHLVAALLIEDNSTVRAILQAVRDWTDPSRHGGLLDVEASVRGHNQGVISIETERKVD